MTKKLRLDLDALSVESFSTGGSRRAGTVRAHYDDLWEMEQQMRLASVVASGCTDGPVTSQVFTPVGCTDTTTSQVYTPVGCTVYTECQHSCGGTCFSCVETQCCV